MNILEVLALLGFGLGCIKFGYELGKKSIRRLLII